MQNVPALEESGTSASEGTGRGEGEGTVGEKTDCGLAACCTIFMRIEHTCTCTCTVDVYMYMYILGKVTALGVLC